VTERYRLLIAALQSRAAAPAAEAAWRAFAASHPSRTEDAVFALGLIGRLDSAFAVAEAARAFTPKGYGGVQSLDSGYEAPLVLFRADLAAAPALARLRRDRRYLALMDSSGLLDAWRDSGAWPDFCKDAGMPYRCETAP
jgi:hypothetical protein